MVLREDSEPKGSHYTRECKKHGAQHGWMQVGEQFFCGLCFSQFLEKHLGQLGVAKICSGTSQTPSSPLAP